MSVRIAQHNMDRARRVATELRDRAIREGIGILLVQEPYVGYSGVITGFGIGSRVVVGVKSGEGVPWAAVVILDPNIEVFKLSGLSDSHCVVVQVVGRGFEFYVGSIYFQDSHPIEGYLDKLNRICRVLRGKCLMIGVDSNAKNPKWGGLSRDDRGVKMEQSILENRLAFLNDGREPTFVDNRGGSSFIDLTLCQEGFMGLLSNWEVVGWTTSLHRVLVWDYNSRGRVRKVGRDFVRYSLRSADWEKFRGELQAKKEEVWGTPVHDRKSVLKFVDKVEAWIGKAASASMKRGFRRARGVNWWNPDLDNLRRRVITARRLFQRERDADRRLELGRNFREVRTEYKRSLREVRDRKWAEFADEELGKGPWNFLYKFATGKIKPEGVISMIGEREGTVDWRESTDKLLKGLIIDDEPDSETHREIRLRVESYNPEFGDRWVLTMNEVREAVWKGKNGKAPGWDGIALEMVKFGWPVLGEVLRDMYFYCIKYRIFPDRWKWGVIRALLKGEDKDPGEIKSYRPICLLPVLGKIFERIIVGKMEGLFYGSISERQFGYMRGRGTEDAMIEIRRVVDSREEKYVMGIFLDLAGAFDRVWWPGVLDWLRGKEVQKEPFELIKDYLNRRSVEIRVCGNRRRKVVNRGCPQGSILGPQIWKVIFDECLGLLNTANSVMVAYADDGALLVWGNSRERIEYNAYMALRTLSEWLSRAKMTLSPDKTIMMMLKGDFRTRQPVVNIQGRRLALSDSVKYLGVYWDKGMRIWKHLGYVSEKANKVFEKICRVIKGRTELGLTLLKRIYQGLFVAIVAYGVGAWGDRIGTKQKKKILSCQRMALMRLARAYRTISTDALSVIVGLVPLDIELHRRWVSFRLRKEGRAVWGDRVIEGVRRKKELQRIMIEEWNERWALSDKGRWTFKFINDMSVRLESDWIIPDYYVTQALSGHGNFASKLESFGLVDDARCVCGEEETVNHVLFECERYSDERRNLYRLIDGMNRQRGEEVMVDEDIFGQFRKTITDILVRKETEERREVN